MMPRVPVRDKRVRNNWKFLCGFVPCLFGEQSVGQPIISEIMAFSGDGIDWVELYNPDNISWDLSGHYLSDDQTRPTKWKFPVGTTIDPDGYLVVYGKESSLREKHSGNSRAWMVANFRLSSEGESIGLITSDGETLIDGWLSYPSQKKGYSYGRRGGKMEGIDYGYFRSPTPGGMNSESYCYHNKRVSFSKSSRMFTNWLEIDLTSEGEPGEIRFTLDGTDPTQDSELFEENLLLNRNAHIRARFFDSKGVPGPVTQASYFRVAQSLVGNLTSKNGLTDPSQ